MGQSTVTLTVNPVAQAPVAATDNYSTGEDVPLVVGTDLGVLANDMSPDGSTLTAEVVTGPAHGTLALNADAPARASANTALTGRWAAFMPSVSTWVYCAASTSPGRRVSSRPSGVNSSIVG